MTYPKIKTIKNNPSLDGLAMFVPNVIFSKIADVTLTMQLMIPWHNNTNGDSIPRRPLIVFLQGSAWTSPDVNYEIPQLAEYARKGYVVATITHRSFVDGYPAPAFLQDTKTAIRFLRKNADLYGIDPNRVCFWGTSSGGNTSLLVALTGDDPRYKTEEYSTFSDSVNIAIDCFGPTDLVTLFSGIDENPDPNLDFRKLVNDDLSSTGLLKEISPLRLLEKDVKYPPLLLLHGDADMLVPYEQSVDMYKALIDLGSDAEMICIENAPHEDSFWSQELHAEILDFIQRKL
ncbi:MAG: alpha/beta hydrolase [Mobilitalea sp.]